MGSSTAIKHNGFVKCIEDLLDCALLLVSDWHTATDKYKREKLAHIKHFLHIFNLKKSKTTSCLIYYNIIKKNVKFY